ncbi:MAG: hypothetical protein QNJ46_31515 [Leptolyngbyaceae cyanobacterium MO_188.B28]|nr:hypothetical protein [Leptolyngbyaceae cyanobacterium MO_188.B28]
MSRIVRSIAIFIPILLSVEGIVLAAKGQTQNIPELPPNLQKPVCENDWEASLNLIDPLIANSSITHEYRTQLIGFRQLLQDWHGGSSQISNLPGCESIPLSVESAVFDPAASTQLDLTAGYQSVLDMRALPSGSVNYEGSSTNLDCWAIDSAGRWIDLSLLCEN